MRKLFRRSGSMRIFSGVCYILVVGLGRGTATDLMVPGRGWQLQSATQVSSTARLIAALADSGNGRIVLMPGHYELDTGNVCDSVSWLCINRAVTIEASVTGTVVLDAKGQRRVFKITGAGVELIGLDITGGYAAVRACLVNLP